MNTAVSLSIVVAVQHAQDNLAEMVERLRPSRHPNVEFLFCHTTADPDTPRLVSGPENVSVLCGELGSLIPHLWRDGIRAAHGPLVAVTTAHCLPALDWVERLLVTDLTGSAGVGGVIENDPASDAKGWAIFVLRYVSYAPPQAGRAVADLAADNAVYRKDALMHHAVLLEDGFWESSFHRRFAADGLPLRLDPTLRVIHRNRYRAGQFFLQRLRHGRQFGSSRGLGLAPQRRLMLLAAVPMLGAVFLLKILARAARWPGRGLHLLPALPWLVLFLIGWTAGEASGYLASLRSKRATR